MVDPSSSASLWFPLRVSIKPNTALFCFGFPLVSLNFPDYFSAICWFSTPHNKMAYMRAAETSIHRAFASSIPGDIRLMFAYGSGVFKQLGHADEKVWRHVTVQFSVNNLCINVFKRWSLRFADVLCFFLCREICWTTLLSLMIPYGGTRTTWHGIGFIIRFWSTAVRNLSQKSSGDSELGFILTRWFDLRIGWAKEMRLFFVYISWSSPRLIDWFDWASCLSYDW